MNTLKATTVIISIIAATILTFSIVLQIGFANTAQAATVKMLPINSSNATLVKDLPKFYSCIKKTVKESVNEQTDPYFKDEPTKNEVVGCYNHIFLKNDSAAVGLTTNQLTR
jgi:hypothetical protein